MSNQHEVVLGTQALMSKANKPTSTMMSSRPLGTKEEHQRSSEGEEEKQNAETREETEGENVQEQEVTRTEPARVGITSAWLGTPGTNQGVEPF